MISSQYTNSDFWMSLVPLFWGSLQSGWWWYSLKIHWYKSDCCFCGTQKFITMFTKCCHLTLPWLTWIQSLHSDMIYLTLHYCLPIIWSLSMLSSASCNVVGFECMSGWMVDVSYARCHFLLWSSQMVKCHLFFTQHYSVLHCWWHISSWIIDTSQIRSMNIEWSCDFTVFLWCNDMYANIVLFLSYDCVVASLCIILGMLLS